MIALALFVALHTPIETQLVRQEAATSPEWITAQILEGMSLVGNGRTSAPKVVVEPITEVRWE